MKKDTAFSFGKNWEDFIKRNFSEEIVEISKSHILNFLEVPDLKNKSFLDVGCGSGLSSLAAYRAGASKIFSFDIDEYSVKTTLKLREMEGNPQNWKVTKGSILDTQFISEIEKSDIVYSWGVLHHTGAMWEAIRNTMTFLNDDSLLYIGLYVTTPKSAYWLEVKKKYNISGDLVKNFMVLKHVVRHYILHDLVRLQNPVNRFKEYRKKRGMSIITDVKDWLGGYPYEHAKIEEVYKYCRSNFNLDLINLKTGEANVEYLFKRK